MFVHLDPFGDVALNEGRARTTFGLGPTVEAFQRLVRVAGRDWCGRFSGHPSDCTTCVHSRRGGRSQVEFGGARGIITGHTVGGPFLSLLAVPTPRPLAPSSTSRNATDQRPRLTAGVRTPASNTERSVKRVDAGPSWSIAYLNRTPICESASRPNSIGRQLLFRDGLTDLPSCACAPSGSRWRNPASTRRSTTGPIALLATEARSPRSEEHTSELQSHSDL